MWDVKKNSSFLCSGRKIAKEAGSYRFVWSSEQVLSKTKSVTPIFFYISDITNSSSFNGKISTKKSMLEKFGANVLKSVESSKSLVSDLIGQ